MNAEDKDTRTLDIVTREAGLVAMEDGPSTADDRRWAEELVVAMQTRIAEHRRNRLRKHVPIKKAAPISGRLAAMPRNALESLFGSLIHQWGPQAQFAHRDLDVLSDNDLRRLIQTIENHTNAG